MSTFAVIIPAAGSGSRVGGPVPKTLLPLNLEGSPEKDSMLRYTVEAFARNPRCSHIIVCAPVEWLGDFEIALTAIPNVRIVPGGVTRQESVRRGLAALSECPEVATTLPVLVHDAARCCVSQEVIERVYEGVKQYGAVTAAVPMTDAVCRSEDGWIGAYVNRSELRSVQTPQGFLLEDLVRAHEEASVDGIEALDDASLVARIRPVRLVDGSPSNSKVTYPGDIEVAALRMKGDVR